jgi:hypothetical protein
MVRPIVSFEISLDGRIESWSDTNPADLTSSQEGTPPAPVLKASELPVPGSGHPIAEITSLQGDPALQNRWSSAPGVYLRRMCQNSVIPELVE